MKAVVVVKNSGDTVNMQDGRDIWYHEAYERVEDECPPAEMECRRPAFHSLYVGVNGQAKRRASYQCGYLVYASMTHQYAFDYRESDIYWCTADVGWITGHSYILYVRLPMVRRL